MFQTEPIIYLQSIGNEWFTFLIILITAIGSSSFLVAVVTMIIFGVDFKKGILLFQLLLWADLMTTVLKILVAFPRPDFVDNRIINLESGMKSASPFSGNGSQGFFELPDKQILETFRHQETLTYSSFGFPSGHVALTTAFWGGAATIFNNNTIRKMTPMVIIVMAFSRMYLGRHFLGDVLGGAAIGLIVLIVFTHLLKSSLKDDFFKKESFRLALRRQNLFFYSFMFIIPTLLTALSLVSTDVLGFSLGANFAYILIIQRGIPDDTGSTAQRTARVFIALLLLGVSSLILDFWFKTAETINYLQFTLIGFLKTFIPASTFWVSVTVCTKLGLYEGIKETCE